MQPICLVYVERTRKLKCIVPKIFMGYQNNCWSHKNPIKMASVWGWWIFVCFSIKTKSNEKSSNFRYKGWFTLATESEAESESEAQGALRSSVNQKSESEAESEARRNRSQKDQKCFFFFRFRFRFRRFRSSENRVNGIGSGSGIVSQSKTHYQSLSNLEQEKKWLL